VIRRCRDGVTALPRDPVIESPSGEAMVTPRHVVIRRPGDDVTV
jgi:hypothetical protein